MPLVSCKNMLIRAREEGYGVGSFNIFNMESAQAIVRAAEEERAPVMLQIWSGFDPAPGLAMLGAIAITQAKRASVPVAVHLDHGATLSQVGVAVASGFTSVMLDGSALPLPENIAITRTIKEFCVNAGIPVEGEIGHVGGSEGSECEDAGIYTDPDEAEEFAKKTGADMVAVSIGTSHGHYAKRPELNIALLRQIAKKVNVPLVLHGSSYTPDEQLQQAVKNGISKINVATELSDAMIQAALALPRDAKIQYANQLTDAPYARMCEVVRHKIRLFGGNDKA